MKFVSCNVIYDITNCENDIPIFHTREFALNRDLINCFREASPRECWDAISNKTGSTEKWNPSDKFYEYKRCFEHSITKIELKSKLDFGYMDKDNLYHNYSANTIYADIPFDELIKSF